MFSEDDSSGVDGTCLETFCCCFFLVTAAVFVGDVSL